MFSRFALLTSFTGLVLIGAITISCGNSSSAGKTACTGGPYDVAGVWSLAINNSPVSTPGVISSAGVAAFFDRNANEAVMPSITGTCSFSGNLTIYIGAVNFGGEKSYSSQGTVGSGPVISGTFGSSTAPQSFIAVPFPASLSGPPTAINRIMNLGDASSPISCLRPGCVQVQVVPSGIGNSANMTLSGTDGYNCSVTGTFAQEGSNAANLNVFDTSITFTGTGCQATGTLTGVGFESDVDYIGFDNNPGPYLYALSSSSADVVEIRSW